MIISSTYKMNKSTFLSFISNHLPFLLLTLLLLRFALSSPEAQEYETYIIHMDHDHKPDTFSTHQEWHYHTVRSLSAINDKETSMVYSYNHVMHGFSARLTPSQLARIEILPAHRATFKDSFDQLLTTHTPKFLGLNRRSGIWPDSSYGKDVIIGLIDTGIWPESESFHDKGMEPVPKRWKGECENGTTYSPFLCNNKIIGARSFSRGHIASGRKLDENEYNSARDYNGHGSHVASIAAGSRVLGVSHFGYASGTAGGIAPGAHIAVYKAVWKSSTFESAASDKLAAMDQAIADGVDILSLSLRSEQTPYFENIVAIGALSAVERGIFVTCAAGNDGPASGTVVNGAPWITTVGAGTIDRTFTAKLKLGNGITVEGRSYFPQSVFITNASLHYDIHNFAKKICNFSALDPKDVSGKVVLCDSSNGTSITAQILELQRSGAIAGIFITDELTFLPEQYVIPSLALSTGYGPKVREYAKRLNPMVKSMKFVITRLGQNRAPEVTIFSSRGPDRVGPGILKPDILAPGFEILAAVSPEKTFMSLGNYNLVTDYELISGTSMAAPHLAGVAALIKAVHRDWSPAAIRSALMTTANTVDNKGSQIQDQWTGLRATPLDFGAGHVDPNKATDPGLVYDMNFEDYIEFICGVGYTKKQISSLLRRNEWKCSENQKDLNYPSFNAVFSKRSKTIKRKKFSRVLTNVGEAVSTYHAVLVVSPKLTIRVEPSSMTFTRKYQQQSFTLCVEIDEDSPNVNYGFLKWTDQHNHIVSSPVVAIYS